MRSRQMPAFAVVAALFAAGCGGSASADQPTTTSGPVVVKVTLTEWGVSLSRTAVPANSPVRLQIENAGKVEHELVLEPDGSSDEPFEMAGVGGTTFESEIEAIHPGATVSVTWKLPGKGGYQLACHVEGHFERGMKASFTAT